MPLTLETALGEPAAALRLMMVEPGAAAAGERISALQHAPVDVDDRPVELDPLRDARALSAQHPTAAAACDHVERLLAIEPTHEVVVYCACPNEASAVAVAQKLRAQGKKVSIFSFPDYESPVGSFIRDALSGKHGDFRALDPYFRSFPYAIDRLLK